MYTFLVILAVITAILLAIVVLIQESKGGGLASNVSGANSVLGVRQTTNFVEKAHYVLICIHKDTILIIILLGKYTPDDMEYTVGCVQRGNELLCEVCGPRRCYRH